MQPIPPLAQPSAEGIALRLNLAAALLTLPMIALLTPALS
jgi:hypothetical protein